MRKKQRTTQVNTEDTDQAANKGWVAPVEGEFTLNVDDSLKEGMLGFMVAMVIRDHSGHFVRGRTVKFAGVVTVLEA